jgi:hypothetical protein
MPSTIQARPQIRVTYPNRASATSRATKATVAAILIVSVALMLGVTIGGWSKLEGLTPVDIAWCVAYLLIAYFVERRWARGLLPIAAALGLLLLALSLIAGIGGSGTSWFDRNQSGFAGAHTLFGGTGLSPDTLGLLTLLIAPVQVLLILFAVRGFAQNWNVEVEVEANVVATD